MRCCRACGISGGIEAHHVIPRSLASGRGPLVDLCSGCHRRWHDGALELLPLLSTEEQAEAVYAAGTIERAREIITRSNRKHAMPVFSEDAA